MADLKMMLQNLRDKSKCCKKDDFTGERYTIIHDMSIETLNMICEYGIEQLENAQTVNRWIPCSERLPYGGNRVLATTKQGYVVDVMFVLKGSQWFRNGECFPTDTVIAWMPMPDAYEPPEKE